MEKFAIVFGSDMFIGTNGILTVEIDGKEKEFFKITEIFRVRSFGSYLTVECDIKDKDNIRLIKLDKSRPVVVGDKVNAEYNHKNTHIKREDGSTIIKIEQLETNDSTLPQSGPVHEALMKGQFEAIIRITGNFYAGSHLLNVDTNSLKVGGVTSGGNLSIGTGGLKLTSMGFSM
jgi:hypothetical protein